MAQRYATADEVIAMFPQFAATPSTVVKLVMECAQDCIGLSWYGERASRAHLLMSAHMLHLHPSAGPTGKGGGLSQYAPGQAVVSMSDGPASVSWAAPSTSEGQDAWLMSSPAGQMLAALNDAMGSTAQLARSHPEGYGGSGYVL